MLGGYPHHALMLCHPNLNNFLYDNSDSLTLLLRMQILSQRSDRDDQGPGQFSDAVLHSRDDHLFYIHERV
jgi:hypothetical protein